VRGRTTEITAWAGPWLVDERWWDPPAHQRAALFQVVTADGTARLLSASGEQWSVEGTYD
jgi:protein ImuB